MCVRVCACGYLWCDVVWVRVCVRVCVLTLPLLPLLLP
jgi:hypothetical protein